MHPSIIGIDSFSFHRFFGEVTQWETPVDEIWSVTQFIDFAAELKVKLVSIQVAHLPDLEKNTLEELVLHLEKNSLRAILGWGHYGGLLGGKSGNQVESVIEAIKASRTIGSSLLRIACGNPEHFSNPVEKRIEYLVPKIRYIADVASDMTIAIENHADFRMSDLIKFIGEVDRSNVGICFDTGNAIRVGDDVNFAADCASGFIKMVHLRDVAVQTESIGNPTAWWPSVPFGRGDINISDLLDKFLKLPEIPPIFVELTNLHPDWPDEHDVARQCVNFLDVHLRNFEERKIRNTNL